MKIRYVYSKGNQAMNHFNNYFFAADTDLHTGNDQDREHLKGKKLEYLYQIESDSAIYPLLGSCLRALGKGWTVQVFSSFDHLTLFAGLRNPLKEPDALIVRELAGNELPPNREDSKVNLVIIDGTGNPNAIKPMRDTLLGKVHVMVAGADTFTDDYDLISRFTYQDLNLQGVTSFTGQGKGKSTSAFGIAVKAAVNGGKAAVVQWFKEPKGPRGTWSINEHYFPEYLKDPNLIEFYPTGAGFFSSPNWDRLKGPDAYSYHREHALRGVMLAKQLISSCKYEVIILDEFVDTLAEISQNIPQSLLDEEVLQELLSYALIYPATRIIVTGRRVTPHWVDTIQRSYVVEEIRHPWSSKGKAAVSGLDF